MVATLEEARQLQTRLKIQVEESDRIGDLRRVAGVDLSGVRRTGGNAVGSAVLLSFPDLEVLEESRVEGPLEFPYIPGYLSFREAPLMIEALRGLHQTPDLVMVDGHGRAHPRRLGIASHLGLLLDLPTIGCAKSRLVGHFEEPSQEAGSRSPLVDRDETIGFVLRTKRAVKPIFVSVGHRVSLESAVELVLRCTRQGQRLPEPTRQAHMSAGRDHSTQE